MMGLGWEYFAVCTTSPLPDSGLVLQYRDSGQPCTTGPFSAASLLRVGAGTWFLWVKEVVAAVIYTQVSDPP